MCLNVSVVKLCLNVSVVKLCLYVSECVCSKIIKELPGLVGSGTPYSIGLLEQPRRYEHAPVRLHNIYPHYLKKEQLSEYKFIEYKICILGGTRCCSWLRHCATSRKVAGSIPDGVIGIFY